MLAPIESEPVYRTLTLTLMFGHHVRLGESALDHKWKMYMEVDCEDEDVEDEKDSTGDIEAITCIRHVVFTAQNTPSISHRVAQVGRPFPAVLLESR